MTNAVTNMDEESSPHSTKTASNINNDGIIISSDSSTYNYEPENQHHEVSWRQLLQRQTSRSWVKWIIILVASGLAVEKRRQLKLTSIPLIFRQDTSTNEILCSLMTPVALRSIRPSLFVGTRYFMNSLMGLLRHGSFPSSFSHPSYQNRFREVLKMGHDGAQVAIDWELPDSCGGHNGTQTYCSEGRKTATCKKEDVLHGSVSLPVVLILHGSNADTSSEYIRSIMRLCTKHGWIAAGVNFRGCGGVPLSTPRPFSIAYSNDLRSVVNNIAVRLSQNVPLFLEGFSLGGNLVVKYLGEEGMSKTLPTCVAGAISISNPLEINDEEHMTPWDQILCLKEKLRILMHGKQLGQMGCNNFQTAYQNALGSMTLAEFGRHVAPHTIRNDPIHPFSTSIGYETVEELWDDASSRNYVQHVTVPLLKIFACDDIAVHDKTMKNLHRCLSNPNVIVMKTKTGGHLGWHHAPWNNPFGSFDPQSSTIWTDRVVTKFIDTLILMRDHGGGSMEQNGDIEVGKVLSDKEGQKLAEKAHSSAGMLRSRL